MLELRARSRTSSAIRELLGMAPKTAGFEAVARRRSTRPRKVGDLLRVRPGEKVPTDGVVVDGRLGGRIDDQRRADPGREERGSKVTGATINGTGSLTIQAERVGGDTLLAQIVRMVGEAQRTRAPIQRLADVIAAYFVPASSSSPAGIRRVGPVGAGAAAGPCAPERGRGADHRVPVRARSGDADGDHGGHRSRRGDGVLIKNAEALERLEKVDTLVIDKTGTLTEGKPRLAHVAAVPPFTDVRCSVSRRRSNRQANIRWRRRSSRARRSVARGGGGRIRVPDGPRRGGCGQRTAGADRQRGADEGEGHRPPARVLDADRQRREGQTVMFVARWTTRRHHWRRGSDQGVYRGGDPSAARRGAAAGDAYGDSRNTASTVAAKLGIDEVIADVLPEQKRAVRRLQEPVGSSRWRGRDQ